MLKLKDAKVGGNIHAQLMVAELNENRTRKGEPFITAILRDHTAAAVTQLWNTSFEDCPFKKGQVLDVFATVTEWEGNKQLKIVEWHLMPDENPLHYLPGISPNKRINYITQLRKYPAYIEKDHFRELVKMFLDSPDFERFCIAPAARKMHSAYIGGLLAHTAHVCRIANGMLQDDLLITGAIFHDIGKMFTYEIDGEFSYTRKGALLEHIIIGIQYVADLVDRIPDFPEMDLVYLQHLIASHHGQLDWGSPVKPQLIQAQYLHQADLAATRIEQFSESENEANDTGSVKAFKLGGNIWIERRN